MTQLIYFWFMESRESQKILVDLVWIELNSDLEVTLTLQCELANIVVKVCHPCMEKKLRFVLF